MGRYFQPGDSASGYVDKTGLLAYLNGNMGSTSGKLLCDVRLCENRYGGLMDILYVIRTETGVQFLYLPSQNAFIP